MLVVTRTRGLPSCVNQKYNHGLLRILFSIVFPFLAIGCTQLRFYVLPFPFALATGAVSRLYNCFSWHLYFTIQIQTSAKNYN
ncbi:hypothetical protein BD769DRAFT_1529774 [Suillus cothurnatus]|nr:hypothetical protein BD769DRAFT_1529774 [Suillus cothurnatus]